MKRQPVLDRELFDALSAANRKLRALFDAKVKERGLTLARARALFVLARQNGLNQRALAEELEIETPTTVRLLDGMENRASSNGVSSRRTAAPNRFI